jgi:protein-disulfide isomerase
MIGPGMGVTSTPSVIVNGWLIRPPPYETLDEILAMSLPGGEFVSP